MEIVFDACDKGVVRTIDLAQLNILSYKNVDSDEREEQEDDHNPSTSARQLP